MSERLVEMLVVLEDAAYIRQERLGGDPDREPDETTEDDVIEALLRRGVPGLDIVRRKKPYTKALRLMIHGRTTPPEA